MKKLFSLLSILVICGFLVQSHAQEEYYVSTTGNNSNDGKTEATAFKTVMKAVEQLLDGVETTIHLEKNATFDVEGPEAIIIGNNKKVTIVGENTTLKVGDKPYLGRNRAITIGLKTDAKISGLTLMNCCTRDGIPGGALFFEGNLLEIDKCTFTKNEANNSAGAIASRGKDVLITNTVFDGNQIFGGYASSAVIYQCGLPDGGEPGSLIIRNCAFTNNKSQNYAKGDLIGFFHAYRGAPAEWANYTNVNYFELVNTVFKDNIPASNIHALSPRASDIYINGVREDFEMNLVNNTFYKTKVLAIPFFYDAKYRLINNIFYNNEHFSIMSSNTSDERDPLIAYNNVFVGTALGDNMDDPAFTSQAEQYGTQFVSELSQLGLTPRWTSDDSYVPYIPITSESSILIDKGLSSTLGLPGFDKELIPATDIRGAGVAGASKDVGSFEYGGTTGIYNSTVEKESLFTVYSDGQNAVIRNLSDKALMLQVRLLDGRTIYQATISDEIVINKSELEVPNGVLIFTATNGSAAQSKKMILF